MKSDLYRARAGTAFRILQEVLKAVLEKGLPADMFLSAKFREEKRFGSKDRRNIRDTVFAYFRWRGLVLEAYPGITEPSPEAVAAVLTAERFPLEQLKGWADYAGIDFSGILDAISGETAISRFSRFCGKNLSLLSVLPEWSRAELGLKYAEWFQKRPSVWLRSDCPDLQERLSGYGVILTPHETVPGAYRCETEYGNLYGLKEYRSGLFEIQDLSSQCIGIAASPKPGEVWFDACAGAGGKTLQLLSMMKGKGELLASDISAKRLEELKKRISRKGLSIRTEVHDLTNPLPSRLHGKFDGVLVDAPCSSSGRWRRNPETRWQSSRERVAEFSILQEKILKNASAAVKPGGRLVYATCSVFREENEKLTEKFLNFNFDFELDENRCILPNDNKSGMLRMSPWDADCDASFAVCLRRKKLSEDA